MLSLRARRAGEWRGSSRLHSSSHLLPPSGSRWHHYLFSAAAPNDSSRFCRGGAVAVPRIRRRRSPLLQADSSRNRLKLFTTVLEGQDARSNQRDVFSPSAASRFSFAIGLLGGGANLVDEAPDLDLVHFSLTFLERVPPPLEAGTGPGTQVGLLCISLSEPAECMIFIFPSLSDMCQGIKAGDRSITSFCRPVSV